LTGADAEAYVKAALSKCVMASDAFFPFDDNVVAAHEGGIRYHPATRADRSGTRT